jgi:acyl-CoA reductase-like NAD-dependent aldehyde dehydrogenase
MIDSALHEKLAAQLLPRPRMLVDGQWSEGSAGGSLAHVNPATAQPQADVPLAGEREVDDAVAAAQAAAADWRDMPPFERGALLERLGRLIEQDTERLGTILALETGLPIAVTNVFARRGADYMSYNGSVAATTQGSVVQVDPAHGLDYVQPEPYGVVALIMTWNGGLSALARKAGAALAAANTVVIKPSELAPFSSVRFAELAIEAGFPPGVINVVHGDAVAGDRLVRTDAVRKVSFTGGVGAARRIQAAAAAAPKPVAMELGGKSANIVFGDADVAKAAQAAAVGALYMSGQGCALPTRLLIHQSIYDDVLERVLAAARLLAIGDPLAATTVLGPIVTERQLQRILSMADRARDAAAGELRMGGGRLAELGPGWFMEPTVFAAVDPQAEIAQEEVFGPLLTVFSFSDDDEAVALANSTAYGLAAYVHTCSLERAHRITRRLECGSVTVNSSVGTRRRGAVATPFGGVKASGFGREGGRAGVEEFLSSKTVSIGIP